MVEAPDAPHTTFMHPVTRGVGVLCRIPSRTFPLEDHLHAKFHPDLSSCLDFYREQTHRQILPFVY